MKNFRLFAIVVLVLSIFATSVYADDFATGISVEVNNQVADANSPIYLEREGEVVVEVYFTGNPLGKCTSGSRNSCYDVRVSAELEGYEGGDVRDVEGPFEVESGVQYRKVLRFMLPEDMPASDDKTLYVNIRDDDESIEKTYSVRIQEVRHNLNVFDAVFNPTNNVQAGQPLFTTVRVENLGDNTESSIKVTVAVPALGIQTSEYVDKLLTLSDESDNEDEDADDAATTNDLLLMIPQTVQEGDYNVVVTLDYNRGRSHEQKTYTMHVKGVAQTPQTQSREPSAVVNVDNQAQRAVEGQGAVYKFNVANLGQQAASYSFEVIGTSDWATIRVDPSALIVQPDSTADAYVYIAPKENVEGIKTFTVKVKSGNTIVAEKNLSLEVTASESKTDAKTILTWVFAVLLIILAILILIILVTKLTRKEDKGIEGQTYY